MGCFAIHSEQPAQTTWRPLPVTAVYRSISNGASTWQYAATIVDEPSHMLGYFGVQPVSQRNLILGPS